MTTLVLEDFPQHNNRRRCGDCSLCCKLLPVRSVNKKANERCTHQRHTGCKVYANLSRVSGECSMWNCRWLVNDDMDNLSRPDRSHYVVDVMPDFVEATTLEGEQFKIAVVQIWCDPKYPDAHEDPHLRAWLLRNKYAALIRYSDMEGFVLFPPQHEGAGWIENRSGMKGDRPHSAAEIVDVLNSPHTLG